MSSKRGYSDVTDGNEQCLPVCAGGPEPPEGNGRLKAGGVRAQRPPRREVTPRLSRATRARGSSLLRRRPLLR